MDVHRRTSRVQVRLPEWELATKAFLAEGIDIQRLKRQETGGDLANNSLVW